MNTFCIVILCAVIAVIVALVVHWIFSGCPMEYKWAGSNTKHQKYIDPGLKKVIRFYMTEFGEICYAQGIKDYKRGVAKFPYEASRELFEEYSKDH